MTATAGERYRNSINAAIVFYSVLIGFSLQDFLALNPVDDVIKSNRLVLFLISAFPFLRILLGSANHLSIEYLNKPPDTRTGRRLLFDLSSLTLFGFIAVCICHSGSFLGFVVLHLIFLGCGVVWGIIVSATRPRMQYEWAMWIVINMLCGVPLVVFGFTIEQWPATVPYLGFQWALVFVASCFGVALAFDFLVQLNALHREDGAKPKT